MNKKDIFILFIILFLSLIFRFYRISPPRADSPPGKKADTAAVARNFVREGIDLLHPRYDDLSGREAGKENPQGYRMVEFPIYNAIFAFIFKLAPFLPIEVYGRLTSAIFSLVVLPETTALSFTFISILFLYFYQEKKINPIDELIYFIVSAIFFAFAILVKPTVIFYSVVLFYLFWQKYHFKFLRKINFFLYFIIAFLPFALWRLYIRNFPEGIPVSDWLITSVNTYEGLKNIFFRPAFFRWIFFERINNIIFGGYLTTFFLLGILGKSKKFFFQTFLLSNLLYLFTFQGGNIQHEYYQTLILPALAIFCGIGVQ